MQPTGIDTHQKQATELVVRAAELRITNQAEYETAAVIGRQLRDLKALIIEYWDGTKDNPGPVKKAYDAWKSLTTRRAEMVDPIDKQLARVSNLIGDYDREIERQRLANQREVEEEARRQRDAEIAAELAAAKAEGAKKAELKAMEQAARAVPVVAPVVAAPTRPDGLSIPKPWKCREQNTPDAHFKLIIEAGRLLSSKSPGDQAMGRTLASFLSFNESAANQVAKAWKNTVAVPGLEFYQDAQPRFGGRR